jgi:hypothetical protein
VLHQCAAPIHPIMEASQNEPFAVKWNKTKMSRESIKWTLGANSASKHKIVSPILPKMELGNIIAHCPTVMHKIAAHIGNKIAARIGNHAANRFALYMNFSTPCGFHMLRRGKQHSPCKPSFDCAGRGKLLASYLALYCCARHWQRLSEAACSSLVRWKYKCTTAVYVNLTTKWNTKHCSC